jgi:peptidoglycan/LPS O-acetylase OafA/YrhL
MPGEKRIPGLDGIRAISIILVVFGHVSNGVTTLSQYGGFGVESFFVLSGFLITWLLCMEEDKRGAISLPSFYARRTLRILPPAFLYIAAASLLGVLGLAEVARNEPLYAAFFVRNLMADGGLHLAHFWSLAIEEQFYLLWPLVFLLLRSDRQRLILVAALIVVAPFWRHAMYGLAGGARWVNDRRFDLRYDALIVGCCLALLRHDGQFRWLPVNRVMKSTPAALVALGAIVAGCAGLPIRAFSASLSFIGVAAFINFSIECPNGVIGSFLNWGPMVWIGQLSYSLYLWQQIFCWHSKLPWLGQFPQNMIAAAVAAALSYYLLERPLADVRRRVPYLSNPRLLCSVFQLPAAHMQITVSQELRQDAAARRFVIRPDISDNVVKLLNAVQSGQSSQPGTREAKGKSLHSLPQNGPE